MIINKNKKSKPLVLTIIILIFFSSIKLKANDAFYAKDHIIHDLKLNILWLRCSVGQIWENNKCAGKPVKLTMAHVNQAILKANEQLGGPW